MSIEAINEQLLRAIGVGVALFDMDTLSPGFCNDTFIEWFGSETKGAKLSDLIPSIDIEAMRSALKSGGRHTAETSFKVRRRTMTVAMEFNYAGDTSAHTAVVICQNITRIKELESMIDSYSVMVERNTREIKREKEQVEKLLLDMMPRGAYEEYKASGIVAPRLFEPVSVLALDFIGFDELLASHEPGVIVSELSDIYGAFDRIGDQFGCERTRTHGDSYVAVSGVPDPSTEHALAVANAAIRYLRYLRQRNQSHPIQWNARIGLAAGSVVGSVIGAQRYIYDVFGPAVTQALDLRGKAQPLSILADKTVATMLDETFELTALADSAVVSLSERPASSLPDANDFGL